MIGARVTSVLLAAWLGAAALFATVVAPSAFAVLPSRLLAGALVGRVLPVLFLSGLVVALAGLALDRRGGGAKPNVRRASMVLIAIACGFAQFGIAPRIERVRAQIDGPIEQLARDDPRRAAFGRLHALSVAWLGVAMLGAVTTVVLASLAGRSQDARTDTSKPASVNVASSAFR